MTQRRFPLAGLLRVRELRESGAAGALSSANSELARGNRRLESLMRRAAEADEPIYDAASLLAVAAGRSASRSMLTEHLAHMEQLEQAAEVAGAAHAEAKRDVKVVQKLRERHQMAADAAELSAEQRVIDEAASRLNRGDHQ